MYYSYHYHCHPSYDVYCRCDYVDIYCHHDH